MNETPKCSNECLKSILLAPVQHKKLLAVILLLLLFYLGTGQSFKKDRFDYLILSQRWLPTACIEYIEHGSSSSHPHYCNLPKNFDAWVIHGLWPTQNNHMGPFFCNKSMPFDISKLEPIMSNLTLNWPNIQGGNSVWSLWQHEWEKHGTCAAELSLLDSEAKYFSTALKFFKTHNVEDLLKKNNIVPSVNSGIDVTELFHIIKNAFGKLPQIHCIHEVKRNQPYLSEVRLCYNKNLELMDCNSISPATFIGKADVTKTLTNCPLNVKIVLPDKIEIGLINKLKNSRREDFYDLLVDILHIIRFFQWASI